MAGPAEKLNTRLLMAAESFHQGARAANCENGGGSGRWRPSRTAGEQYAMLASMKNILTSSFLGLWALALLAGCGGSSGGTCANAAACGGAIVGMWKITSSCVTVDISGMMNMDCPGETLSASSVTITGAVTYNADMTYSANSKMTGDVVITVPASCLSQEGGTVTCDELTQALQASMASMFQSANCVGAGSGC